MSDEIKEEVTSGGPGDSIVITKPDAVGGTEIHTKTLHKGFNGEITTPEDLVKYTQNLESLLITRPAAPAAPQAFGVQPNAPARPKGESFEELVYSDPLKAKEVLLGEWDAKQQEKDNKKARQAAFWDEFYRKNVDLKELPGVVQSVFKRDLAEFQDTRRFSSDNTVAEHLAKEARQIIGMVREKAGVRETRVDSSPAMTFGESGGGMGNPPPKQTLSKPISFADQLIRMRKSRK